MNEALLLRKKRGSREVLLDDLGGTQEHSDAFELSSRLRKKSDLSSRTRVVCGWGICCSQENQRKSRFLTPFKNRTGFGM